MIVLDCCAAIEMILESDFGMASKGLICKGDTIIAPHLFEAELANSVWKYLRARVIDEEEATEWYRRGIKMVDRFIPTKENAEEALSEAGRLQHPVYDLLYLTLARRNCATLITADKQLNSLCDKTGVKRIHEISLDE